MQLPDDHHYNLHRLMTSKLIGAISSEEEAYLDQVLEESQEARELWKSITGLFPQEDIEGKFKRLRQMSSADVIELLDESRRRRRLRIFKRLSLAAAAILGVMVCIYFLYRGSSTPTPQMATQSPKTIKLKLASGAVIDFSQNRDSIQAGNALLNNTNNSLSYIASGNSSGLNTLIVPNGITYHVQLSDGSEVWLNAASTLQFPFNFSGDKREITVNGEAYIKVAQNAKKPFIVHLSRENRPGEGAGGPMVQVLGTEFNINSYNDNVKVALVSGSVKLKVPGGQVAIKPGTEAKYAPDQGITTQAFDEDEVLGWRDGRYFLYEIKLQDIARKMLRWRDIKVVIDDPSIKERSFTGVFNRNLPLTAFLEELKQTAKVAYYFAEDSTLHLTTKE